MKTRRLLGTLTALIAVLATFLTPAVANASGYCATPSVSTLTTDLKTGSGSTFGPDGKLYVTEPATGRVLRVDPRSGRTDVFFRGLPPRGAPGIGGAMDIEFVGRTAYVLVTLVGPDVGGSDIVGIYRLDGRNKSTVIADIGAWTTAHPPAMAVDVPSGVQYALESYRGGFLVTDGHHNRVYRVGLNGDVREVLGFTNIVPTGLAIRGNTVYLAEAGPVPHLPETGKVVAFPARNPSPDDVADVATGARLLVDVQFGGGRDLYGLSQGVLDPAGAPGAAAEPNTGSLVRATRDGGFDTVIGPLNQPTSLEIRGNTAYVVTLAAGVLKIENLDCSCHGGGHH